MFVVFGEVRINQFYLVSGLQTRKNTRHIEKTIKKLLGLG